MKTRMGKKTMRRRMTLLDLVVALQDRCRSDAEVVAVVAQLVNRRRVVLCGTFAGRRIPDRSL